MISVAEWDSIYNKSLELISVFIVLVLLIMQKVKGALDPHAGTKDVRFIHTILICSLPKFKLH